MPIFSIGRLGVRAIISSASPLGVKNILSFFFTSIIDSVLAEKGENKPGAKAAIEEVAKLHYQVSICETIIRVQMLKKGGKTWKQEEIDGALSEVALTAAVMSHKLLHDRISHSVGHKLGAVKKKAATD